MAKFKYIGDPNDNFAGPRVAEQQGYRFIMGEVVEIPEETAEDKERVKKLQGHSHFVDMSNADGSKKADDHQKALETRKAEQDKAAEEQRENDAADEKQRQENLENDIKANPSGVTTATAPRPPGNVTRDAQPDAFGGRTVEQRTATEDHTKAGKTKG